MAAILELVLSLANHLDERLGGLKTGGHDFLIRLGLALVDEVPGVPAPASIMAMATSPDNAAGNHNLEHGALTLAPAREGDPLSISQTHTETGLRTADRKSWWRQRRR